MADYPDPTQPQPAHPGQQPWASGVFPAQGGSTWSSGSQPQNLFGSASPPSLPSGYAGAPAQPVPAPAGFPPGWQPIQRPVSTARPFALALLAFPFLSLKMFVWPGPATFTKEQDRVGWKAICFLLLVGAAMTGGLASLWGRVARLTPGIANLSAGRVVPQPLSVGVCAVLAVSVPVLFLLLEGMLYWVAKERSGQRSRVRAQLYTGLLIEAPLYAFVVGIALVLLYQPALGSSARLLFAGVAGAFLLYSFVLHVFAVMAVHQVSAGKATLSVAVIFVILGALVILLAALVENAGESGGGGGHASGGASGPPQSGGHHAGAGGDLVLDASTRGKQGTAGRRAIGRFCPNCGLQVPAAHAQAGLPCPRCGTPLM